MVSMQYTIRTGNSRGVPNFNLKWCLRFIFSNIICDGIIPPKAWNMCRSLLFNQLIKKIEGLLHHRFSSSIIIGCEAPHIGHLLHWCMFFPQGKLLPPEKQNTLRISCNGLMRHSTRLETPTITSLRNLGYSCLNN